MRLGWKTGGCELRSHPWFKDFNWKKNDKRVEIFKPEFNDPLHLDFLDTDQPFICKLNNDLIVKMSQLTLQIDKETDYYYYLLIFTFTELMNFEGFCKILTTFWVV